MALNRGARGSSVIYQGPYGIRLYAHPTTGKHCHFKITGELLEPIGTNRIIEYSKSLQKQEYEVRATRVDVVFDNVPFTPEQCNDTWRRVDIPTKANQNSWSWYQNAEGNTFSMGALSSKRFIRVYDRRDPTKFEIEFKEDWAENFLRVIAEVEASQWIEQRLGGLCGFHRKTRNRKQN